MKLDRHDCKLRLGWCTEAYIYEAVILVCLHWLLDIYWIWILFLCLIIRPDLIYRWVWYIVSPGNVSTALLQLHSLNILRSMEATGHLLLNHITLQSDPLVRDGNPVGCQGDIDNITPHLCLQTVAPVLTPATMASNSAWLSTAVLHRFGQARPHVNQPAWWNVRPGVSMSQSSSHSQQPHCWEPWRIWFPPHHKLWSLALASCHNK